MPPLINDIETPDGTGFGDRVMNLSFMYGMKSISSLKTFSIKILVKEDIEDIARN
jgi:hypothetical protein